MPEAVTTRACHRTRCANRAGGFGFALASDTRALGLAMIGVALIILPWPSRAASTFGASVSTGVNYDSNVFDLQRGYSVPGTLDYQHSDTLFTYGAALDGNFQWSQESLFAKATTTQFQYQHFTQLNHNEYDLDAGWNWTLGPLLNGTFEAERDHTMVAFSNVNYAEYVLQTDQHESGKLALSVTPDWRLEGSGFYDSIVQTFQNAPNIDLDESQEQIALRYLGVANLASGLSAAYTVGDYTGSSAALNPSFRQTSVALVATYKAGGRSTFDGTLGYSDRTSSSALNAASGLTGQLDYADEITGKTTIQVQLSRIINNYVANIGSEFDSIGTLDLRWQATYKLGLIGGYTWTYRELPGQGNAPLGSNRLDHLQYASLKVDYEPRRWLSVKVYVDFQTRSSNFVGANFNATTYGIYFTIQRPDETTAPFVPNIPGQPM